MCFIKQKNKTTVIHTNDGVYIAYAMVESRHRILCKSTDRSLIYRMLEKYKKNPGHFTFRYKD